MPVTIVNAGYRSTNYWVLTAADARLIVDLGWPGTIGTMRAGLERKNIPLAEIRYGLATHYHPDHAGCAEDLKRLGMTLIVTPEQVAHVGAMTQWTKPAEGFTPITLTGARVVPCEHSRAFLASMGLAGQILHTPGHSDDSVTLLLDSGEAFTGDLTPPGAATEEHASQVADSWSRLRSAGAKTIYPGHGQVREL